MRELNRLMIVGTSALMLCATVGQVLSQTNPAATDQRQGGGRQRRGNFDPAQFQQRMMERYRERLEITDDAEWKAIQPLVQNVLDARMSAGASGRATFGRGPRRETDSNSTSATTRRGPTRENPAADELQKAIDSKVPAQQMKAALAKYTEYRKAKQAEVEKARDALRAVLTSRQEAIATLSGLL